MPAKKRFKDNSVDMGTGYDCFHELSHPGNMMVGVQQRANRMLLQSLMIKHGFTLYDQEWWHFTLKDEPFSDRYFDFSIKGAHVAPSGSKATGASLSLVPHSGTE